MEKIKKNLMAKLFNSTTQSIYNWEKDKPIIDLIYKYFNDDQIEEFLETGKIDKLENKNKSDDKVNAHILFHAISKIKQLPNFIPMLPNFGKKEFDLNLFFNLIYKNSIDSKDELIKKIKQDKNLKNFILVNNMIKTVEDQFSRLEIELIIKHKDKVMQELNE